MRVSTRATVRVVEAWVAVTASQVKSPRLSPGSYDDTPSDIAAGPKRECPGRTPGLEIGELQVGAACSGDRWAAIGHDDMIAG